jgi:hypothetical protein
MPTDALRMWHPKRILTVAGIAVLPFPGRSIAAIHRRGRARRVAGLSRGKPLPFPGREGDSASAPSALVEEPQVVALFSSRSGRKRSAVNCYAVPEGTRLVSGPISNT